MLTTVPSRLCAALPLLLLLLTCPVSADEPAPDLAPLVTVLKSIDDDTVRRDVLKGMRDALRGSRNVGVPDGWKAVYPELQQSDDAEVRRLATLLALSFGDRSAFQSLRKTVRDEQADPAARKLALQALVDAGDPQLVPVLLKLLDDEALRRPALRGLAAYDDERIPAAILNRYDRWRDDPETRRDAVQTLAARVEFAFALLQAIEEGSVPSRDLSAFTVRQMLAFENAELERRIESVWGSVRPSSQDKAKRIAQYKSQLTEDALADADRSHGRLVFKKTCAACHKLFDDGRTIGPELTGSQRSNLDYVLQNLVDPNALIGRDFRMTTVVTTRGRVVNGIVAEENDNALVLHTANDRVTVPLDDIVIRKQSDQSLMPEGMVEKLKPHELRDLVAYLASPVQVPLPDPQPRSGGSQ